jgi:hypothetical protein
MLSATVITPPTAGTGVELVVKALHRGSKPPEYTLIEPRSFPKVEELTAKRLQGSLAAVTTAKGTSQTTLANPLATNRE